MKNNILKAIIYLIIGAFVIYWAIDHSPKANLGQIIGNEISGSYTMSETWYYVSLGIGAIFVLLGLKKLAGK